MSTEPDAELLAQSGQNRAALESVAAELERWLVIWQQPAPVSPSTPRAAAGARVPVDTAGGST